VKLDQDVMTFVSNLGTMALISQGMYLAFRYLMARLDKTEVDVYGPRLSSRDALAATGRTTQPPEGFIT